MHSYCLTPCGERSSVALAATLLLCFGTNTALTVVVLILFDDSFVFSPFAFLLLLDHSI